MHFNQAPDSLNRWVSDSFLALLDSILTQLLGATSQLVVILNTARFEDKLPQPFEDLLTNEDILKVGASIGGDCALIHRHFDVLVKNTADVLKMAKKKISRTNTGRWGLADVCDTVLAGKMRKVSRSGAL